MAVDPKSEEKAIKKLTKLVSLQQDLGNRIALFLTNLPQNGIVDKEILERSLVILERDWNTFKKRHGMIAANAKQDLRYLNKNYYSDVQMNYLNHTIKIQRWIRSIDSPKEVGLGTSDALPQHKLPKKDASDVSSANREDESPKKSLSVTVDNVLKAVPPTPKGHYKEIEDHPTLVQLLTDCKNEIKLHSKEMQSLVTDINELTLKMNKLNADQQMRKRE